MYAMIRTLAVKQDDFKKEKKNNKRNTADDKLHDRQLCYNNKQRNNYILLAVMQKVSKSLMTGVAL
jgi:hypothetical protein